MDPSGVIKVEAPPPLDADKSDAPSLSQTPESQPWTLINKKRRPIVVRGSQRNRKEVKYPIPPDASLDDPTSHLATLTRSPIMDPLAIVEVLQFSKTQRGNSTVLFQGYEYAKFKKDTKGIVHWRCRVYFATKCKAMLKTQEQYVVGEAPQHCHDSNPQKAHANFLANMMKQNMKAVGATPSNVVGKILSGVSDDIVDHLPRKSSLLRNLATHRDKTFIPIPTTSAFDIPEKYSDLILHDTGADDPERILAIGNNHMVLELHKDAIYGDGTFDKAPEMFYQLYTWHAKIGNSYPPCIYFLIQNNDSDTYNRMFTILKQLVPGMQPRKILLDFEKKCMTAAQVAFPQAEIKGCYFHLCQSVKQKINSVGLKTVFESDIDIKLKLKSLSALCFIPIADVKTVFNRLASTFPEDDTYNEILTYFSSTYIEGVAGRKPLFPIEIWNQFEAAAESTPETINCCEGFHNVLNSLFHYSHLNVWNLLDGLKRNITCQQTLLDNINSGRSGFKKKKYENLSLQVAKLCSVKEYDDHDDKLKFLRRMANLQ